MRDQGISGIDYNGHPAKDETREFCAVERFVKSDDGAEELQRGTCILQKAHRGKFKPAQSGPEKNQRHSRYDSGGREQTERGRRKSVTKRKSHDEKGRREQDECLNHKRVKRINVHF